MHHRIWHEHRYDNDLQLAELSWEELGYWLACYGVFVGKNNPSRSWKRHARDVRRNKKKALRKLKAQPT